MATGFSFRYPNMTVHYAVYANVETAQSQAAFNHGERSSIELPRDWDLAYAAGYRIVPAKVQIEGATRPSWKGYQRG